MLDNLAEKMCLVMRQIVGTDYFRIFYLLSIMRIKVKWSYCVVSNGLIFVECLMP